MNSDTGWVLTLLTTIAAYTVLVATGHSHDAHDLAGTMALVLVLWGLFG